MKLRRTRRTRRTAPSPAAGELTVQQLRYLARLVEADARAAAATDNWGAHQLATDVAEHLHQQIDRHR